VSLNSVGDSVEIGPLKVSIGGGWSPLKPEVPLFQLTDYIDRYERNTPVFNAGETRIGSTNGPM